MTPHQEPIGQIFPDTYFGRVLTRLAMNSQNIVEIGCWRGGGSTRCLAAGLVRPEQRMWSVDCSPEMIAEARSRNPDPRIEFLCGTILTPTECSVHGETFYEQSRGDKLIPEDEPARTEFFAEMGRCEKLPYIGDKLPEKIDLLLLDGGEYSSRFEYLKLYKRAHVIALDDIRKDVSWKNYQNYQSMMSPLNPVSFHLLFRQPYERHGWAACVRVPKRQTGHLEPLCKSIDDIDKVLADHR